MSDNSNARKNTRPRLAEIINKKLDISPDVLPGGTHISIRGREAVTVDGSVSILLYSPEEIRLSLCREVLSIKGCRLVCTSYHAHQVTVDGRIFSVSFEEA